jgi:para-nitrobenzyl esterase
VTVAEATTVTGLMAGAAGVPPTLGAFAALPPAVVLRAQDAMLAQSRGGLPLGPVADGDVVAGQPWEVLRSSYGREVDLICGFMHEEFRTFLPGSPMAPPGGIDPVLQLRFCSAGGPVSDHETGPPSLSPMRQGISGVAVGRSAP